MSETKKRGFTPSLLKIMRFVMVIIIPVTVITILMSAYSIEMSTQEDQQDFESDMNYHISLANENYSGMISYLVSTLENDVGIEQLRREPFDDVHTPYLMIQTMENLASLKDMIDPAVSLYLEIPRVGTRIINRSTKDEVLMNIRVSDYIKKTPNRFPYAGTKTELFETDGHQFLIARSSKNYAYMAIWIDLQNLFSFMDSVISSKSCEYMLLDENNLPIKNGHLLDDYLLTYDPVSGFTSAGKQIICDRWATASGISIVTIRQPEIRLGDTAPYLGSIVLLSCIAIGFCTYLIHYFRKHIEEPLKFFQNHINDYFKERRFTKRYGFAELEGVQSAFTALERQVEELKIDIYEERLSRTKTELEFLQNQIKPHFFVNCFNIIVGMAEWEQFDRIQDFCMLLSSYVRYTLTDGFEAVTLEEELAQSQEFLAIQNIRFDTDTSFVDVADKNLLFTRIPPMTILSFIENSVKHNKFKVDALKLQVSVSHIPGGLHGLLQILYTDNGVGMDEKQCEETRSMLTSIRENVLGKGENVSFQNQQIGIQNVYRRMLLLYGERAKMELLSAPGEGYAMMITIPVAESNTPAKKEEP